MNSFLGAPVFIFICKIWGYAFESPSRALQVPPLTAMSDVILLGHSDVILLGHLVFHPTFKPEIVLPGASL